jgi:S1-C subfamily serine protease
VTPPPTTISTFVPVGPKPTPAEISAANVLSAAATGAPQSDAMVLQRAEVNAALGNFASLAGSVKGSFTPEGVRLEAIAVSSLFAKAGLKAGDLVTSVNNQPLKSIDDAANLYARVAGARALIVAVTRASKPITLRVVIQ